MPDIESVFTLVENEDGEVQFEYEDTLKYDVHHVWTVVEGDSDPCDEHHTCDEEDPDTEDDCACCQGDCEHRQELVFYPLTGYHIVNRLYYFITKEPWADADSELEYTY
jgi:hypothetical protein